MKILYFTQLWSSDELDHFQKNNYNDCRSAVSTLYSRNDLSAGDYLYIISFRDGKLRLLFRVIVESVVETGDPGERLEEFFPNKKYTEKATFSRSTRLQHDNIVPGEMIDKMIFVSAADCEKSSPAYFDDGRINPQSFRGVRRITKSTAAMFDELLMEVPIVTFKKRK